MYVAPAIRFVVVQAPRAVYWKMPPLPSPAQPEIDPSPAPMSDEMTARCRFGKPPGSPSSDRMNAGKLRSRFACDSRMLDESSIKNRMSTLRLVDPPERPPLAPPPPPPATLPP